MALVKLIPHDLVYAERIYNLVSVPHVKDVLGINDDSVEDTKRYMKWIIEDEKVGKQVSRLILNESNELVGITTLMFINSESKQCHIGTWIGHEYWGMGYNEASKIEILKIAFKELGMNYVFAGARKLNVRSQKAQQKLSFIRLHVENEFPNELVFLEKKEKQSCVLHAFYKEDFFDYLQGQILRRNTINMKNDVQVIVRSLIEKGIVPFNTEVNKKMSGTTDGLVYTLTVQDELKYVLKFDNQLSISFVKLLHHAYKKSPILPKLLYIDPSSSFIVYSYIYGTTHYNRGLKTNWMADLVINFLNHYEISNQTDKWGRLGLLRESWLEFNKRSLEEARGNVGDVLPIEDYYKVKSLIENISEIGDKYLLHGDTGVHNFVFHDNRLVGVIDPSPMVGPVIYDFTYAFCSSPDDLNLKTLLASYKLLNDNTMERSKLIEVLILQIYCRIGLCIKHHPNDLNEYLEAWDYWKLQLT